jgi:uncharacterized protein (DUF362 family)
MTLENKQVVVNFVDSKRYPAAAPFDPPERYPEYAGKALDPSNRIYAAVRDTLYRLGLDRENFGGKNWNPLKDIVQPGMTVFIKPNTVTHNHLGKKDIFSAIIHASILRPILDYVCLALKNEGKIIIGDSQVIFGEFDKALSLAKIDALLEWYRGQTSIPLACFDLRINRGVRTWMYGKWGRIPVEQDPNGYQVVNLGSRSCFNGIDPKRLRIAIASYKNMYKHHSNGRHEYVIPKSFLECDAVISLPKLKTHRRTAVTLAIKNFMGIPAWKDSLPHFMTGSVQEGGDQYIFPSLRKRICLRLHDQIQSSRFVPVKFICALIKKLVWNSHKIVPFKDDIYEGMWHGNDTLWRTLLDLNRIVFYADKNGNLRDTPQRKFFCLIDGIIAGEKDGPISPDPVPAGVLLAGFNPVAIDAVGATLMGFDVEKIPLIKKAMADGNGASPLYSGSRDDIEVLNGENIFSLDEFHQRHNLRFEPHPNWKGHVELA